MYKLIKSLSTQELFLKQIPTLAASIVIAELFYKFHSFALECGAFLLTWYVLDLVISQAANFIRQSRAAT